MNYAFVLIWKKGVRCRQYRKILLKNGDHQDTLKSKSSFNVNILVKKVSLSIIYEQFDRVKSSIEKSINVALMHDNGVLPSGTVNSKE